MQLQPAEPRSIFLKGPKKYDILMLSFVRGTTHRRRDHEGEDAGEGGQGGLLPLFV
jgi:hypothetical protein